MEEFKIPPDLCLVVRAFSQTSTLREAAALLQCDPAALVRKAQKIATEYRLMQKIRGRWALTESGLRAVQWVEQGITAQKLLMGQKPCQRIATTMWIAEQLLIPGFLRLHGETEEKFTWTLKTASPNFESDLLNGSSDYVISCSTPTDPVIAHRVAAPEDWIAIAPFSWIKKTDGLSVGKLTDYLKKRPFIRHASINPEAALGFGTDHDSEALMVDTLIGVRAAVEAGHGWSCVPKILVRAALRDQRVSELKMPLQMQGRLCVWWLRERKDITKNVGSITKWLSAECLGK